jgi:hypothetical protein
VHPFPDLHAAPGHLDDFLHDSVPVHATSHAQDSSHETPFLHDSIPEHVTEQRPLPQTISSGQLSWPVHSTRQAPFIGQTTL